MMKESRHCEFPVSGDQNCKLAMNRAVHGDERSDAAIAMTQSYIEFHLKIELFTFFPERRKYAVSMPSSRF